MNGTETMAEAYSSNVKRRTIGKRLRFEVLKRDRFTCQYCGRSSDDGTELHVDHIVPVSSGGTNTTENLTTACIDCNLGKSNISLEKEHSAHVSSRQIIQTRNRLAEIISAADQVFDMESGIFDDIERHIRSVTGKEFWLSRDREIAARTLLQKYDLQKIFCTIILISETYKCPFELFDKLGGALFNHSNPTKSYSIHAYYCKKVLNNRLFYTNDRMCMKLVDQLIGIGGDPQWARGLAKEARSWTDFRDTITAKINKLS